MPVFRFIAMWLAKSLSKLFGLATVTFFGRQPSRDDDKAAGIGLASLLWLPLLVVVFYPDAAEWVFPEVPGGDEVNRVIALALAVLIPPGVGYTVSRLHNQQDSDRSMLAYLGLGYMYTLIIGLLVVALVLIVPLVKASYILRRFELQHIAVMIERGHLDGVVDAVLDVLHRHGIEAQVESPNRLIRWVFGALVWVEGHIFRRGFSTDMVVVRGEAEELGWFEITIHATDITVIGQQEVTTRLGALFSEELDVRVMYFTWDAEAQELEDALRECRGQLEQGRPCDRERMDELRGRLAFLQLSREEWDAVHRQLYLIERDSERLRADLALEQAAASPQPDGEDADPQLEADDPDLRLEPGDTDSQRNGDDTAPHPEQPEQSDPAYSRS